MKKTVLYMTVLLPLLSVVLFVAQLCLSNDLAENGTTVYDLDREIQVYTDKSLDLKQKIASESSLASIALKAQLLGFSDIDNIMTLPSDNMTVALNAPR